MREDLPYRGMFSSAERGEACLSSSGSALAPLMQLVLTKNMSFNSFDAASTTELRLDSGRTIRFQTVS